MQIKKANKANELGDDINIRLEPYELAALDLWIAMNTEDQVSRSDAIRTIITRTIINHRKQT
jgi:citrate lyase gamma subunit